MQRRIAGQFQNQGLQLGNNGFNLAGIPGFEQQGSAESDRFRILGVVFEQACYDVRCLIPFALGGQHFGDLLPKETPLARVLLLALFVLLQSGVDLMDAH